MLDPKYRAEQGFAKGLLRELAPRLNAIPFNRDVGMRSLPGIKNLFRLDVLDYREKQLKHARKLI
jgi:hypothetical protein